MKNSFLKKNAIRCINQLIRLQEQVATVTALLFLCFFCYNWKVRSDQVKLSKFDWQMPATEEIPASFLEELKQLNLSPVLIRLLWNRNLRTLDAIQAFMNPSESQLHDPFLLHDMEKVVERIHEAVVSGERILIYGDYDADGITSTTVMKETFELLGAQVETYLPNRFTDGYGPNVERYKEWIDSGIQLIVTVDNGVSGHEAIAYANSQGVDVIVTDHHELPNILPDAYGIIHPRHPEGTYPFGELAGVGVAFKLAWALLEDIPMELLDLVAIGTIADMVSLTDENRAMVIWGLEQMKQGERLGISQLLAVSGSKMRDLDETTIGFSIAPRLNAIGRLGDPNPAIELLTTFDEEEAKSLAQSFDEINQERKDFVERATKEALEQVDDSHHVHLLVGEDWHEGILGIVAGRVLQVTGKPTIALTTKNGSLLKGSGRSTESLNMFQMLSHNQELLTTFGGHHAAVGLSFSIDQLETLRQACDQYIIDEQIDLSKGIPLMIDGSLDVGEVDLALIKSLKVLAPFGMHNPVPRFLFEHVKIPDSRSIGAEQKHLKFTMTNQTGQQLEGIGFNFGPEQQEITTDDVSLVGELTINEWNGKSVPQIQLQDYQITSFQLFDFRGKKHHQQLNFTEPTIYITFSKKLYKVFSQQTNQPVIYVEQFQDFEKTFDESFKTMQLVFVDVPHELDWMKQILKMSRVSRIYLMAQTPEEAYLNGIGSREQYGKLFKLIKTQKTLDVRYKLDAVAQYTKIPKSLLIFMVQVFLELKFVTIDNGILNSLENPMNRSLSESLLYQKRQQLIKNEEFLVMSDLETIKKWISSQ